MLQELDTLKARWEAIRPLPEEVESRVDALVETSFIAASNMIEDRHSLTLEETEVFLESGLTSAGRRVEEFLAIERHRDALREARARAKAGAPLTVDLVRQLHLELTRGLKDKEYAPGEWKTKANRQTTRRGRPFRYAAPEQVPELMRGLVAGYEGLASRVHPVEAVGWFAYHFHLIHPFNEANGRVQRLVSTFLLLRSGYRECVIEPRERGVYLDALSACDSTVAADKLQPLYAGIETRALVEFLAGCAARTLEELLGLVEGNAAYRPADAAKAAEASQRNLILRMKETAPEIAWRHDAAQQIRQLNERIEATLTEAHSEGPLYAIEVEPLGVKKDHGADESVRPALPSGGAGLVGETVVAFRPSPTAAIAMPAPRRFVVAVAASRMGLHVVSCWEDEPRPVVRHGTPQAAQWSQATLEKHLAERIDTARRAYDAEIVEMNRGKDLGAALRSVTAKRPSLAARVAAEKASAEAAAGAPARAANPKRRKSERLPAARPSERLGGIRPSEPPLPI